MQIDIRKAVGQKIDQIKFWDANSDDAHCLSLNGIDSYIADGTDEVYIRNVAHANYLIQALQKAIELGNWDE